MKACNADVIALHEKLSELGYYGLRAGSPWSEESVYALKNLQEGLGMEATGVIATEDDQNFNEDAGG